MPEPPRRKRFQIHLSTAIVLMFVAGALIWANSFMYPWDENIYWRGWPVEAVICSRYRVVDINHKYTLVDVWIAFTILYVAYRFCEWLHRDRAAREGA